MQRAVCSSSSVALGSQVNQLRFCPLLLHFENSLHNFEESFHVRTMGQSTTKLVADFRFAAGTEKPKAKTSYPRSWSRSSIQPPRLISQTESPLQVAREFTL